MAKYFLRCFCALCIGHLLPLYRSEHDCEECAALNGRRVTVLEAVDQDPLAGIACRISMGSKEDLAPLGNLSVGARHPARPLLQRYGYWCREHLLD